MQVLDAYQNVDNGAKIFNGQYLLIHFVNYVFICGQQHMTIILILLFFRRKSVQYTENAVVISQTNPVNFDLFLLQYFRPDIHLAVISRSSRTVKVTLQQLLHCFQETAFLLLRLEGTWSIKSLNCLYEQKTVKIGVQSTSKDSLYFHLVMLNFPIS